MAWNGHVKRQEAKAQQKISNRRMIAGGRARGGGDTYDYNPLTLSEDIKDTSQQTRSGQMAQQQIVTPAQQQAQQQEEGSTNPFLLDAPPAFQPAQSQQDANMLAMQQQPQGQQPPPATQPAEGRQAPGLLSGNLGVV